MREAVVLFVAVYTLNCVPAFAPPTWMALSWVGFNYPGINLAALALIGAAAATLGRLTLAKLSRAIIRQRLMNERNVANIDAIREALEGRRVLTAGVVLFYAFSPFPSNYLFIAYGLTSLDLRLIALPFFAGRFISYYFWAFSASAAARHIVLEYPDASSYFNFYFVVSQAVVLALLYLFTKIDWRMLLTRRKLHWFGDRGDAP